MCIRDSSIWDGDCIVAMARMNGDMGLNYYIKDVVVRPEYQGKGIGRMLINELKKLHTSLIFNIKVLITINSTHNLYAIFARILDICKQLTSNLAA